MESTPRMNDGRSFNNYANDSELNQKALQQNNIRSNWEYRQFLQNNSNDIIKYNFSNSNQNNSQFTNPHPQSNTYNSPYIFKTTFDSPNGNNPSDLKSSYWEKEKLSARLISPSIPTNF